MLNLHRELRELRSLADAERDCAALPLKDRFAEHGWVVRHSYPFLPINQPLLTILGHLLNFNDDQLHSLAFLTTIIGLDHFQATKPPIFPVSYSTCQKLATPFGSQLAPTGKCIPSYTKFQVETQIAGAGTRALGEMLSLQCSVDILAILRDRYRTCLVQVPRTGGNYTVACV